MSVIESGDDAQVELGEGSSSAYAETGATAVIEVFGAIERVMNLYPAQTARRIVTDAWSEQQVEVAERVGLPYIMVSSKPICLMGSELPVRLVA